LNPRGCETAAYNQQNIHSFNKCGDTTYLITRDDMQVEINVRCHIFYPFNSWKLEGTIGQYIELAVIDLDIEIEDNIDSFIEIFDISLEGAKSSFGSQIWCRKMDISKMQSTPLYSSSC
jgi:hypothetical protein